MSAGPNCPNHSVVPMTCSKLLSAVGLAALAVLQEVLAVTGRSSHRLAGLTPAWTGICSNRRHAHGCAHAALHHVPTLLARVADAASTDDVECLNLAARVVGPVWRRAAFHGVSP